MKFDELTPEQLEKVKACKTPEDILALAKKEGYSLSDDELQAITGGTVLGFIKGSDAPSWR